MREGARVRSPLGFIPSKVRWLKTDVVIRPRPEQVTWCIDNSCFSGIVGASENVQARPRAQLKRRVRAKASKARGVNFGYVHNNCFPSESVAGTEQHFCGHSYKFQSGNVVAYPHLSMELRAPQRARCRTNIMWKRGRLLTATRGSAEPGTKRGRLGWWADCFERLM
jgi:hypothetical protein